MDSISSSFLATTALPSQYQVPSIPTAKRISAVRRDDDQKPPTSSTASSALPSHRRRSIPSPAAAVYTVDTSVTTVDVKGAPTDQETTTNSTNQKQEKPIHVNNNDKKSTDRIITAAAAAATTTTLPRRLPPPRPPTAVTVTVPSPAATVCNALDGLINAFIDSPPRPSVDPRRVLSGNFAPVHELPPVSSCPVVKGSIPPCLAGGAYIRNGPNPQHLPLGPHHLFDGDGMLHSLLLPEDDDDDDTTATFCSRFVRTYKYSLERDAGSPVIPNAFAGFHGFAGIARGAVTALRVLTGQLNPLQGIGVANTSLVYFANQLFALGESDLPYAVHLSPADGDLSTVGRVDFDGKLAMGMTAHPKKDPETGELFAFRYGPIPPFLTYFWFDRDGNKQPDVPVFGVERPSFLHDFAVTKRHAVFVDIQIVMKPLDMVIGDGSPVGIDPGKVPRVGVMPRYANSERDMRWFDVPGFNPVHIVNAWDDEEGDALVLVAPNVLTVENALERTELVHSCMEMVRIDLRDGTVRRTPLSAGNLDFAVINPSYAGRKNRYVYAGVGDPMPKIGGVVKLDLEQQQQQQQRSTSGMRRNNSCMVDCVVASRMYGREGAACFGGEPFFVPKEDAEEEDDGYVVSYVHDEKSGESKFLVMDAKSPELETVAEVLLPRRVPYGFHGIFLTKAEIKNQKKLLWP